VFPLVRAERMAEAGTGRHRAYRRELLSAVLAGVPGFLAPLVEDVFTFVRPCRMPEAGTGGQRAHAGEALAAVGAIELWHNLMFLILWQIYTLELPNPGSPLFFLLLRLEIVQR
jgi:hypothetical protein